MCKVGVSKGVLGETNGIPLCLPVSLLGLLLVFPGSYDGNEGRVWGVRTENRVKKIDSFILQLVRYAM